MNYLLRTGNDTNEIFLVGKRTSRKPISCLAPKGETVAAKEKNTTSKKEHGGKNMRFSDK
jgi:hypothetical protein